MTKQSKETVLSVKIGVVTRVDPSPDDGEPTWILEHAKSQRRDAAVQRRMNLEVRLRKLRDKELRQKKQYEEGEPNAKKLVCVIG